MSKTSTSFKAIDPDPGKSKIRVWRIEKTLVRNEHAEITQRLEREGKVPTERKLFNNEGCKSTLCLVEKHNPQNRHIALRASLPIMAPNMSLFSVNAVLILSTDDSTRILTKYYSAPHPPLGTPAGSTNYPGANAYPNLKDQKAFEKGLLEKTAKQTNDIILYDNRVVVFKMESDVMMYVVGGADENEVLLYSVILALRDSLNILLK